jgi:cytochrome c oxidase subunit III
MAERPAALAPQYDTLEQQHDAATLGMWVFLATELMLFGGLFTGYAVYRFLYPAGFVEGSRHLEIVLGAVNTAVLIVSSLTMALAVHSAQVGARKSLLGFLTLTVLIGSAFMSIKGVEYYHHYQGRMVPGLIFEYSGPYPAEVQLFFLFYFTMTAVHAIHLSIAIAIAALLVARAWRGAFSPEHHSPIELLGLYWHFVDIVWIFLLPLLYLPGVKGNP